MAKPILMSIADLDVLLKDGKNEFINPRPDYVELKDRGDKVENQVLTGEIYVSTTTDNRYIAQAKTERGVLVTINPLDKDKITKDRKVTIAMQGYNEGTYLDKKTQEKKPYKIPNFEIIF